MRTEKEIKKIFRDAVDSEDGHFYDSDECWYCGYIEGIKASMLYFLGEVELQQKIENGSKIMESIKKDKGKSSIDYYREFSNYGGKSAYS